VKGLYVSPLKAWRSMWTQFARAIAGIARLRHNCRSRCASRTWHALTGDTSVKDSRQVSARGADLLITTPESLYLL